MAGVQGSDPVLICIYTRRRYVPAACGHFGDPKREREITAASEGRQKRKRERKKKKKRRPRASRDALAAASNDSGNSIPVGSRGEPRASR